MVNAGWPLLSAKTFAARPVGANSIMRSPNSVSVLTNALASDVFPVPADPLINIHGRCDLSAINWQNTSTACFCSAVGSYPKVLSILS